MAENIGYEHWYEYAYVELPMRNVYSSRYSDLSACMSLNSIDHRRSGSS